MGLFILSHRLINQSVTNANRDQYGHPKTAIIGDAKRGIWSSQSQKYPLRQNMFKKYGESEMTIKSRVFFEEAVNEMVSKKISSKTARDWAATILEGLGSISKEKREGKLKQDGDNEGGKKDSIISLNPSQRELFNEIIQKCIKTKKGPVQEDLDKLYNLSNRSIDSSLFGSLVTPKPKLNVTASVSVAFASTTNPIVEIADYFISSDDLTKGSAYNGISNYLSGCFYTFKVIDRDLLLENIGGDKKRVKELIRDMIEEEYTTIPTGRRATTGNYPQASYIMIEIGTNQPRDLKSAFCESIRTGSISDSIKALEKEKINMDKQACISWDVAVSYSKEGSSMPSLNKQDLLAFVESMV